MISNSDDSQARKPQPVLDREAQSTASPIDPLPIICISLVTIVAIVAIEKGAFYNPVFLIVAIMASIFGGSKGIRELARLFRRPR